MLQSLNYQSGMLGRLSRQSLIVLGQEDAKSGPHLSSLSSEDGSSDLY